METRKWAERQWTLSIKYQEMAELERNSHWAVLSSWFGPIVRKEVEEARHAKKTAEHIKQAVRYTYL